MSYVPVGGAFKNRESIYKITLLAARRAIELNNGARRLVESDSNKPSTIALEEISQGKVKYKAKDNG